MDNFKYLLNSATVSALPDNCCSAMRTVGVAAFHKGIPGYGPTPLVSLPKLAERLGLAQVWVKDESRRFGLNAFKALGGSYAIGEYLSKKFAWPVDENSFARLLSPEVRLSLGELCFVTATDGNHGRGIAWAAKMLGHRAVVYMPAGSAEERLANIRSLGAEAYIMPYGYDDCVRHAGRMAQEHGWILVQDTAWEGYEDIPTHIMQGYTTMGSEIRKQMPDAPTHLFLQAGVGSMAGAMCGYFSSLSDWKKPVISIVEPDKADCHFRTASANDGKIHFSEGPMDSMMAGLCCGEPCTVSWEIIKRCAEAFISCGDEYSARGMKLLYRPENGDESIVSGESGAVTAGVLEAIMTYPELDELKISLGLNEKSVVLLISTEGDTDKENFRRIVEE